MSLFFWQNVAMIKHVACAKCHRLFIVKGKSGNLKELLHGVRCPYAGCFEMNEVMWPLDGSFEAVSIYSLEAPPRGKGAAA